MCGISGILSNKTKAYNDFRLKEMLNSILHRGPDGKGLNHFPIGDTMVSLGHVRLSIIDLSDDANQPFISPCGNYALTYNGEIYNYLELKKELEKKGYQFRTSSDTEVLLYSLICWGSSALNKLNGMWAFAFLDKLNSNIIISRDRVGIKPLYYLVDNNALYFGSEIKSILAGVNKKFCLKHKAIANFLTKSLVNYDEQTFYDGIFSFPPASYACINLSNKKRLTNLKFIKYWDISKVSIIEQCHSYDIKKHLENSINLRLRSDVPVGLTLSGGLDSSSILALALKSNLTSISGTISAVSNDSKFSEEYFVDKMNTSCLLQNKIYLDEDPHLILEKYREYIWFNDQPLLSFSAVAFGCLMEKAKEIGLKVILSGQGADELFFGYRKYLFFYLQHLMRKRKYFKAMGVLSGFLFNGTLVKEFNLSHALRYLPNNFFTNQDSILGEKLRNLDDPISIGLGNLDPLNRSIVDITSLSVPSLLHYEDRFSMANSTEVRVPFLDHNLIECALGLRDSDKLKGGWTKWALRDSMKNYLPNEITWRKDKQGFCNPQEQWFKNEFRETIQSMFKGDMISYDLGLLNKTEMIKSYSDFLGNRRVPFRTVYNAFALEEWLRVFSSFIR